MNPSADVYNGRMAQLELSFLGAFLVSLARQPITHFRSANNQALLVFLILQSDRPHLRERLAGLFWSEEPIENAAGNLRQALYQLRKLLGDTDNPQNPYLLINRQTVQFNLESDFSLDVARFLSEVERGDLEAAVAHYHGELLPGFTCDSPEFESWLRQERETLQRLALEALFELTRTCLKNGRFEQAQAFARRQLALDPGREPACRQLMEAYALAGDRSSALRQFESCREQLRQELGVEVAPETVALYEDIRSGRFGPVAAGDLIRPPRRERHNLPAATTPLIGREPELARLGELFVQDNQRLVTIAGAGGMGKTRLALALGEAMTDHYRDGVYLIDLAPVARPESIPEVMAAALEFRAPDPALPQFPQLVKALRSLHRLYIFDNFEHLLAGAPLVVDLLKGCPEAAVLATSRQRLNLASENLFELGGLSFPNAVNLETALDSPAIRLFVDYARHTRPDFDLTKENLAAVAAICRLVDGMPLALVLAAAWLQLLTPAEILAEIERSPAFLAADLADLPPRQRSLQAVFERTWQMLAPAEQAVMARLSVFRGGFTREAAEAVAGADLRVLLSLTNQSLLQRQLESGRFHIHELLGQFAAARLEQAGESEAVRREHCRYFAGRLASAYRAGGLPLNVFRQLAVEHDNFRAAWAVALERGWGDRLVEMVDWMCQQRAFQGQKTYPIVDQALQALQEHGVSRTDPTALQLQLTQFDYALEILGSDRIRAQFEEFFPLVEQHGDQHHLFLAYTIMANLVFENRDAFLSWEEKAYQAARVSGDARRMNLALRRMLSYLVEQGIQEEIESAPLQQLPGKTRLNQLERLLAAAEEESPDSLRVIFNLVLLSKHCTQIRQFDLAVTYARRALDLAKDWRHPWFIGFAAYSLADSYLELGQPEQAARHLLDDLDWHLAIANRWQALGALWSIAGIYSDLVGPETTLRLLTFVYDDPEATPLYRQEIDAVRPRLENQLGTEAAAAAQDAGKRLDFDQAVALLRATLQRD